MKSVMKDQINDIRLIEKFLDGRMTTEERKDFENKLSNDQALNTMMTDLNLLVEGIKMTASQTSEEEKIDRLKFFAEINEIEKHTRKESAPEAKVIPLYRKPWLLTAAASVLLLVALTYYFTREQTPLNEKLYTAYFE